MFSVPIVRKKTGIGPKPRKKRQVIKPCGETKLPKSPEKVIEISSLSYRNEISVVEAVDHEEDKGFKPEFDVGIEARNSVSVKELDDVEEPFNIQRKGRGFGIQENDPEEQHEAENKHDLEEEYKAKNENDRKDDLFYCDNTEFVHKVVPEGDEAEFRLEEDYVGEEEEGVDILRADGMGNVVEAGMEYFSDETEGNEDDHMHEVEGHEAELELDDDVSEEVKVGEEMGCFSDEIEGNDSDDNPGDEMAEVNGEEFQTAVKESHNKMLEVFVGGLEKKAAEADVKKVASEVGKVIDIKLMKDPFTRKNEGFGSLEFATVEQANHAVTEVKNLVVNGKQCNVYPCKDNDTLFLGNICKRWTKRKLIETLKHFGVKKIGNLTLVEDAYNEGMNRGFAFLQFFSHSDAMSAYKRLQNRDVVLGVDRSAKVSFAYPSIELRDKIATQVKRVFLDDLPASWDEDYVKKLLKKFGEIEKIELARYKPSAKRKDFGFVTFNNHDAAVACVEAVNNIVFREGDKKVKVKAILADSFQKRKWKHLGRGNLPLGRCPDFRGFKDSRDAPTQHHIPIAETREIRPNVKLSGVYKGNRSVGHRDRRSSMDISERDRPLPPPPMRSCDRKSPIPFYAKNSTKKYYVRQGELPSRNRSSAEYGSQQGELPSRNRSSAEYGSRQGELPSRNRSFAEYGSRQGELPSRNRSNVEYGSRQSELPSRNMSAAGYGLRVVKSYKSEYPSQGSGNSVGLSRSVSYSESRKEYVDRECGQRFLTAPSSHYRERACDNDSYSGSKRRYSTLENSPPRFADTQVHQSRARLDYEIYKRAQPRAYLEYEIPETDSHYADAYGNRSEGSHPGYATSSRSFPGLESYRLYCDCQDMGYGGCSFCNADDKMYSPSHIDDYTSPVINVCGSSYSISLL